MTSKFDMTCYLSIPKHPAGNQSCEFKGCMVHGKLPQWSVIGLLQGDTAQAALRRIPYLDNKSESSSCCGMTLRYAIEQAKLALPCNYHLQVARGVSHRSLTL